ncbi:MAG: hypothetical protein RJA22_743 [Verrucomicrobiota bacterium]
MIRPARPRFAVTGQAVHFAARLACLAAVFFLTAAAAPAAVRITELLAENDGGLRDADGDTPDWVELFNDSAAPVNLGGWRLTDAPGNLSKWTFPAVQLPSGGLLLVFASGKNRAVAGAELHANFRLEQAGGHLALVRPDGATIEDAVTYPAQRVNVSYGLGISNAVTPLVPTGATARVFVPSNSALGLTWSQVPFNDTGWISTNLPVGFAVGANTTPILSLDFNERGQDPASTTEAGFQPFLLSSNLSATAVQTQATTRAYGAITVTVSNTAPLGYDDRLRASPLNSGAFTESLLLRDFVFSPDGTGTGGLDVSLGGLTPGQRIRVMVWSYDSGSPNNRVSDWFVNGTQIIDNYTFAGSATAVPTNNSQHRFSGDQTVDGAGRLLVAGRRDTTSTGGLGVFLNALQVSALSFTAPTNGLAALMLSNSPSAYVRVPFVLASASGISSLTLRIRCNDGFVAYLNGQPVASRNAPAAPQWNSTATAVRSAALAEDILIIPPDGLLVAGTNLLALHGLNVAPGDADFTLAPELSAQQTTEFSGRYFQPPTPATNNGPGLVGLVADTKFSVNRGFHFAPFFLSITTATAGAQIRWTTNGSAPSPVNGNLYTTPFPITGQSFVRAAAFKPGFVPSDVDTHSYLFLRDILRQSNNLPGYPAAWQAGYPADYGMDSNLVHHPVYGATLTNDLRSLHTLCIVSEQNGLWNSVTGIYPNPTSVGPAWERAASLELIASNNTTEFALPCQIELHGNASRDNVRTPKHSLRLSFSGDYGPAKLRYDWFGGGVETHDKIILRSCGFVDGWAGRYADTNLYVSTETGETFRGLRYRPETTCYLRDVWVKESFRAMGWTASRSAYVHLYLNGLYWGLYQPSERIDASYWSQHAGGAEGAWDVLVGNDFNQPPDIVDGTNTSWNAVLALANAGVTNDAAYQAIGAEVDLDNLIDFMLLHIFAESEDWPFHNWYLARRRPTNGLPGTKWTCTIWDQELTLDRLVRRDRTGVGVTGGEVYSPARVYNQLRPWPEFRRQFGDRVQKHLFTGGALTPSNSVARLLGQAALIRSAVVGESARWGDARKTGVPAGQIGTGQTFTRDEYWQPEIDKLSTNFLPRLTADNIARLRATGLYPTVGAPTFSQHGGAVPAGFSLAITHTNPAGTIYYTTDGADPRTYGSGAVAGSAQAYATPLPVNQPTVVRARVLSADSWSALVEATFYPPQDLSRLALTEIMFNPAPTAGLTNSDLLEFVELKNTGTNVLNLSGLVFSGIGFTFTNGTELAPGAFCVLVRDAATFAARHPGVALHGVFAGGLNNAGETLTLSLALGGTVFSVAYNDDPPWPAAADGLGFSLVPRQPGLAQAPDAGADWRASAHPGGSPGADDPEPAIPAVVINEILTHSDPAPPTDTIELFNPGAVPASIGGWFLTDDRAVPRKFRIPDGTTLGAGGFITFSESDFNATPGTNGSFSLSSHGESVHLFSADAAGALTGYGHGFGFGAAPSGVTFGRHLNSVGGESFPAQIARTFNAANAGPRIGPVVFSEIHYHPLLGEEEFIELLNVSTHPVALLEPANPTNTWRVSGLDYALNTNLVIPAGGLLVLAAGNPDEFRAKYAVPAGVPVVGPWLGSLQDSGERLRLERPDVPDTNGTGHIVVEELRYNDRAPWPPAADGGGASLQRLEPFTYGDDPASWIAAQPTPGRRFTSEGPDSDGDGLPDAWEQVNGTQPFVADGGADPDGDGMTNLQEFGAGTHPLDAASVLAVQSVALGQGVFSVQFLAVSNRTYTLLGGAGPTGESWVALTNLPARAVSGPAVFTQPAAGAARFFRVVTP